MKNNKREKLNLFFSAFLVIGFIVCTYFFMTLANKVDMVASQIIRVVVYVLFGLLLFYATRVGDGSPVKRFSPIILIVLDIPALLIILFSLAPGLPLYEILSQQEAVVAFACIALGYGIPFTFLSGFELVSDEVDDTFVSGGIKEELDEIENGTVVIEETEEIVESADGEEVEIKEEITEVIE